MQVPTGRIFLQQKHVEPTVNVNMMLHSLVGLVEDIAIARAQVLGVHTGFLVKLLETFLGLQEAAVVLVSS